LEHEAAARARSAQEESSAQRAKEEEKERQWQLFLESKERDNERAAAQVSRPFLVRPVAGALTAAAGSAIGCGCEAMVALTRRVLRLSRRRRESV